MRTVLVRNLLLGLMVFMLPVTLLACTPVEKQIARHPVPEPATDATSTPVESLPLSLRSPTATQATVNSSPPDLPAVLSTRSVTAQAPLIPTTVFEPAPELPTATPVPACVHDMAYVADLNLDDQNMQAPPVMEKGQSFTKSWRIQNTGDCPWDPSFTLVYVTGNRPGAQMSGAPVSIGESVPVGGAVDVHAALIAPQDYGVYQGYWQMRHSATGEYFGETVWVGIQIPAPPTATPLPAPSPTATPPAEAVAAAAEGQTDPTPEQSQAGPVPPAEQPADVTAPEPQPAPEVVADVAEQFSPLPPPEGTQGSRQERFIASILGAALTEQADSGVPASFSIAQSAMETGWGRSELATKYNNFHHITCSEPNEGLPCVQWGDGLWNQYSSPEQGFLWHGRWLRQHRQFAAAFEHTGDLATFAQEVLRCYISCAREFPEGYYRFILENADVYHLRQYDANPAAP